MEDEEDKEEDWRGCRRCTLAWLTRTRRFPTCLTLCGQGMSLGFQSHMHADDSRARDFVSLHAEIDATFFLSPDGTVSADRSIRPVYVQRMTLHHSSGISDG